MTMTVAESMAAGRALEVLRQSGNPFRNYFARNPDDEVCARYHVPELFSKHREQLLVVIDLYRYDPTTHSEIVPILGIKGAGKTHLLHSIKHGQEGAWQLLVTPSTYQPESNFLEYLLFQVIDTLLSGGEQKGARPMEFVSEELGRRLVLKTLASLTKEQQLELFPGPSLGKWARRLGLGTSQAQERTQWIMENLNTPFTQRNGQGSAHVNGIEGSLQRVLDECNLDRQKACELVCEYIAANEPLNTTGLMRRSIYQGFIRAALLNDESELANFLTFGFAELDFKVQPNRQDLVLVLFKALMEVFLELKIPVVVAFDQLEDLLLGRRRDEEEARRTAETFFAGIVQVMHQIDGICFLIFAERGMWNRFVGEIDGYIRDRLNNPVHVPGYGTIKALRLEAPTPDLLRRVVEARMRPSMEEVPDASNFSPIFPFNDEQVIQIARTEPTLRDMLIQFRHLFDHVVYGEEAPPTTLNNGNPMASTPATSRVSDQTEAPQQQGYLTSGSVDSQVDRTSGYLTSRFSDSETPQVKSEVYLDHTHVSPQPSEQPTQQTAVEPASIEPSVSEPVTEPVSTQETEQSTGLESNPTTPAAHTQPTLSRDNSAPVSSTPSTSLEPAQFTQFSELWDQELRSARRKLEPNGALTGATRELQAGLGAFLELCNEHGVKVGPWRLQHVVPELTFGDHPTYGVFTIAHWVCKDGQPWKVGIGLFLGRGAGKPRDLSTKLESLEINPPLIDHLILLRNEDDCSLTGKTKTAWNDALKQGRSARLEPVSLDGFSALYGFPRWLAAIQEALREGQPLPNVADILQEKCETLLEQVCMPISQ
ncbi:MAG: hypothetical protein ACFCD0_27725 [Gemmataceae bacterium]